MKAILLGLMIAAAALAQAVEGTVISAPEGTPLPDVKVELAQNGSAMRRAMSDGQGAFRFDEVAPGEYTVELTREGYRPVGRSAVIRVIAGAGAVKVSARMLRLGDVSGRVTGDGRPMAHADVRLLVVGNLIGQIDRTDDGGEFRFRGVDPGTYILSARAAKDAPPPSADGGRKKGWVRTWYPSARDAAGAARIVVSGGADLYGQDIALRGVAVHRVSGQVLSVSGGPMQGVEVDAAPPDEFAVDGFESHTRTAADGGFVFEGLAEGDWRLTAKTRVEGVDLYAAAVEAVGDRDIERVELRFVAPFALTGKVVRTPTGTPAEKKQIGLMLAPREGGSHLPSAPVQPDGSFRIENVAQGVYRFQPTSPDTPYYLASVEMNGHDVTGQWVEVAPGTLPVTITYRADGGTVRGTVEDCRGATVVLAPRDAALQYQEFIRTATCGQDGRYEISAVRPGDYYAWAFDRPPGMLELGSFAGMWINGAERVTVRAGEASELALKVTERR